MANPLFNQFGSNNNPLSALMAEFNRLSQSVQNPRQEVERLLNSGQMSQQQFNELSRMASQLLPNLKK